MYDELINDLLNEASDLLDESAGKNGLFGRYNYERYKSEKAQNDAQDKEYEDYKNAKWYKKLKYRNKPEKADRLDEKISKLMYDDDQRHKRFTGIEKSYWKDPKGPERIEDERIQL